MPEAWYKGKGKGPSGDKPFHPLCLCYSNFSPTSNKGDQNTSEEVSFSQRSTLIKAEISTADLFDNCLFFKGLEDPLDYHNGNPRLSSVPSLTF